jgi:NADP-dependent 3-hydroxy acid dehydrogenase YdfG
MTHLLVVGAGPGIAAATVRRLAGEGDAVGLIGRNDDALAELADGFRGSGAVVGRAPAEAGDPASLTAAIRVFLETFGPVDVLLYNVSVGRQVTVPDLAPEDLLADLAAGTVGLQTAVSAVLPGMRELGSGTVLVTGSGSADRPITSMATLGVQKAALRALAQVQAEALAPEGVHVATVTIRGLVGEDRQITPDRIAALYAELVAETAGPRESWRSVVDVTP